jgi:hypothetical protein
MVWLLEGPTPGLNSSNVLTVTAPAPWFPSTPADPTPDALAYRLIRKKSAERDGARPTGPHRKGRRSVR